MVTTTTVKKKQRSKTKGKKSKSPLFIDVKYSTMVSLSDDEKREYMDISSTTKGYFDGDSKWNIYTDGGSKKRDGSRLKAGERVTVKNCIAASGVVWVEDGIVVRDHGYGLKKAATNNEGELCGIYFALVPLMKNRRKERITIWTDSLYCIKMLRPEDLRRTLKRDRANSMYINGIRKMLREFEDVKIKKVPGHSGVLLNEMADRLCTKALSSL